MAQEHLDLFEFTAGRAAELCRRAPQIVGCDTRNARGRRVRPQELPHYLFRQPLASQFVATVHGPEDVPLRYAGTGRPGIDGHLHPCRHLA
jgi:hypothetical protein